MDNSNLFLTSEDVATILRVSKRTLQNYRSEGNLMYYKVSAKVIRYRVADVVEFLKQRNNHSVRGRIIASSHFV